MRILFVYHSTYPWDVRIEKMVTWLNRQGHEVRLLCANRHREDGVDRIGGLLVHRLRRVPSWTGPLQMAMGLPSPVNPVWLFAVKRLLTRHPSDVVVVRDLHVALAAIAAGHLAGLPVVLDLAENWPALLRDWWRNEGWTLQNVLLRRAAASRVIERLAVALADHVLVVVDEMRDRLIGTLGLDSARVSVVMNTPQLRPLELPRQSTDALSLVYLGEIHQSRGLDTALRAVAHTRSPGIVVRLRIIGRGKPTQERRLRALADELNIRDAVEFLGWMPQDQAFGLAAEADVGLCPFPPGDLSNTTISNKMFEYMNLGLPVLCSDVKPARRIIEETGAGLLFAAGSVGAMAAAITRCFDPAVRAACGAAGKRAVEERYNWEIDAAVFESALLETLCRRTHRAASNVSF